MMYSLGNIFLDAALCSSFAFLLFILGWEWVFNLIEDKSGKSHIVRRIHFCDEWNTEDSRKSWPILHAKFSFSRGNFSKSPALQDISNFYNIFQEIDLVSSAIDFFILISVAWWNENWWIPKNDKKWSENRNMENFQIFREVVGDRFWNFRL